MTAVYLDHNATTPIAPPVLEAMLPFLREEFGNPSANYPLGQRARHAVDAARAHVAVLINANPDEIIFTSGGTEASNMAICGALAGQTSRKIVTSVIEHPATDEPCKALAAQGHDVRRIAVLPDGRIDLDHARKLISAGADLVTLIHAQNEIGTLQPVAETAAMARQYDALLHIDAAQSVGKIDINVGALGIDLLSIAGHKLHAPKGVGALFVRRGVALHHVLRGAGQESGRRPGTENVAAIVGLGEACRQAALRLHQGGAQKIATTTRLLLAHLQKQVPGLQLTGHATHRLPNTLTVLFPGVSGRKLLEACPDVYASTGSACHADREDASAVLRAIGLGEQEALGAVRLSLGFTTTPEDAERAAFALAQAWHRIKPDDHSNVSAK